MSEKLYLLNLNGGGDTHIILVTEAVWDWICSPYISSQEKVPEAVLLEAKRHESPAFDDEFCNPDEDGLYYVSMGSYENDRAMGAPGHSFWTMKEAFEFIKDNDIEIIEEFDGYLY